MKMCLFSTWFSGTMILENASVVGSIPSRHKNSPSYYHSFGMTDDYIVFVEQPLYVDEVDRNGLGGSSLVHNNLKWKKTEMVRTFYQLLSLDLTSSLTEAQLCQNFCLPTRDPEYYAMNKIVSMRRTADRNFGPRGFVGDSHLSHPTPNLSLSADSIERSRPLRVSNSGDTEICNAFLKQSSMYNFCKMMTQLLFQVNIYLFNKVEKRVSPVVYCCEPFFFFHFINAFQQDASYVCIDLVAYKDAEVSCNILAKFLRIQRSNFKY